MKAILKSKPVFIAGAIAAGRKFLESRRRQRRKTIALRIIGGVLGALTIGVLVRLMSKPEKREKLVDLVKQNKGRLGRSNETRNGVDDQISIRVPEVPETVR
jgi:hypothetical protein